MQTLFLMRSYWHHHTLPQIGFFKPLQKLPTEEGIQSSKTKLPPFTGNTYELLFFDNYILIIRQRCWNIYLVIDD
jgi:hypothetical protein